MTDDRSLDQEPSLRLRRLLDGFTGIGPLPRPTRIGAPMGAVDSWDPPHGPTIADDLDDMVGPTFSDDLIHLGLPNGTFSASDDEEVSSEYWTGVDGTVAWAVVASADSPGGWVWRYTVPATAASSVDASLTSARVPIVDIQRMAIGLYHDNSTLTAGRVRCKASIMWYDEDGTLLSTTSSAVTPLASGTRRLQSWNAIARNTASADADAAAVRLELSHIASGGPDAGTLDLRAVVFLPLRPAALLIDPSETVTVDTAVITTGTIASLTTTTDLTVASGLLHIRGVISPTPGSDQDDWAPTGIATASVMRINPSAAIDLTGLDASQANGRVMMLFNLDTGANTVTLKHQNASSAAQNRFSMAGSVDRVLHSRDGVMLWYDGTSQRWRALAP